MSERFSPADLDRWFPPGIQQQYVEQLRENSGLERLTRRRAQCFVRLWGYCLLKQYVQKTGGLPAKPLDSLLPLEGSVACTQGEASTLFYAEGERGSDRSAGMMINQLVAQDLVRKDFDGNLTHISIFPPANFVMDLEETQAAQLVIEEFNPRTDAVLVANCLAKSYSWMHSLKKLNASTIKRGLRHWSTQYPQGMRVLRQQDSGQPVGFYCFFPVASSSEDKFFAPPSESLYLFSEQVEDPLHFAQPGDSTCEAIAVRSWHIDQLYWQLPTVIQLVEDSQQTLAKIREDYPNLCDLYGTSINPDVEALSKALGFQSTTQDPNLSLSWLYLAVDHFLDNTDVSNSIQHLFP